MSDLTALAVTALVDQFNRLSEALRAAETELRRIRGPVAALEREIERLNVERNRLFQELVHP